MRLKYFTLLCMVVLVSTSCGKSAKAKCKEKYFAYKKDFPSVEDINDTVRLNECIVRLDEVLTCADSSDYEYGFLLLDKKSLIAKRPVIIRETSRNYSTNQIKEYATGLNLRLDSVYAYRHCFISTDYTQEDLLMDSVTLDGSIEYKANNYPRIKLEIKFASQINEFTADFIELRQGMTKHREDNFILVDFEGLSDFSNNPYDYLLGSKSQFKYGTIEPDFDANPFFASISAELPLTAEWGNSTAKREITIPTEKVKQFELLVDVFQRMRTGRP